ncbi:trypsin inhibitor-like [Dermacentor silvarum]|uniref:trypsin inhibitor-like n=1 Tax=Dermacentor silvarum TaxID=543639 RepID=UPI0018987BF7|nr:trypsin inhibitor-like [Dermacentor silvarum]
MRTLVALVILAAFLAVALSSSASDSSAVDTDECCQQEVKVGKCKASFPRWAFKTQTGKCEEFIWGGCDENCNNFETKEACEQRCHPSH